MESLRLNNNKLSQASAPIAAKAILENKHLKFIDLSANSIGADGIQHLTRSRRLRLLKYSVPLELNVDDCDNKFRSSLAKEFDPLVIEILSHTPPHSL